jgi:hypothetical protein
VRRLAGHIKGGRLLLSSGLIYPARNSTRWRNRLASATATCLVLLSSRRADGAQGSREVGARPGPTALPNHHRH